MRIKYSHAQQLIAFIEPVVLQQTVNVVESHHVVEGGKKNKVFARFARLVNVGGNRDVFVVKSALVDVGDDQEMFPGAAVAKQP